MSQPAAEDRFRRLYQRHYPMLLSYALRRSSNPAEAHDVVADTFLVLWRRFDRAPDHDAEIPLWLYAIARRVLSNQQRSRVRRERLVTRLTELSRDSSRSEEEAVARERAHVVVDGLMSLDPRDREVLLLAAWENLTNREIAEVLGCSENAAALRLHRARRKLTEVCRKENSVSGHEHEEGPQLRRHAKKEDR
jgi:RNA polymerase sigma factor (sigma-70 family)